MEREWASTYGEFERWHWWFRGRQKILEAVLRRAFAGSDAAIPRTIVSVGCGPPAGLAWLTPFVGEGGTVVGLDADPSGALRAAPEAPASTDIRFLIGTIQQPPLRPRSVGAVLALDVIEHLDDDVDGLASVAGLVAPGGFLLVTVPAFPSLWGRQDTVSHHRRRYTRRSLADAFQRAGLKRPRLTYFNTLLFPPIAAVRWSRRLIGAQNGDGGGKSNDFEENRPGLVNGLLEKIFAAERFLVPWMSMPFGVSLLALSRPA